MGKTKNRKNSKMAENQDQNMKVGGEDKQKKNKKCEKFNSPCIKCNEECVDGIGAVECDGCNKWAHQECIEMSDEDYDKAAEDETKLNWICDICKHVLKQHYLKDHNANESFWFNELKKAYQKITDLTVDIAVLKERLEDKAPIPKVSNYSQVVSNHMKHIENTQVANKLISQSQDEAMVNVGETVIVAPIDDDDDNVVNTCSLIKKNINPHESNFKVNSIKNNKRGEAIIKCPDKQSAEKLKNVIKEKLCDKVIIKEKEEKLHRLECVIYKNGEEFDEDNTSLQENLIEVNELKHYVPDYKLRVVTKFETRNKNAVVLIIDVNQQTHNYLMITKQETLKIHTWLSVRVRKHVNIKICSRCQGYGHTRKFCRMEKPYCRKCARDHETKDCDSHRDDICCAQCYYRNEKTEGLNLDTCHYTHDRECPIYQSYRAAVEKRYD
jgi:hypothetical protein